MEQNVKPLALVRTLGCLQNENDSEKIRGLLSNIGYDMCADENEADVIIINTCAVRDNAEKRVYGNIGALKKIKDKKPSLLIGVCGCMMQQHHVVDYIKKRFEFVDFIFGTHTIHNLPQIIYSAKMQRTFDVAENDTDIHENIPQVRDSAVVASVSIMYGCNNFCSYCIVPYVRGRERSRKSADILSEVSGLAAQGYKEITLLGQNVNSYGKNCDEMDFADLLTEVSKVHGIERIRFVSSHPKDVTDKLIGVIATNPKVCKQLHLPFQAGSDKVLNDMNRKYTKQGYLNLIEKIRKSIPDIAFSSDIIVGFPTETNEDFADTIDIVSKVGFDMLYTFIYSPRKNTPAAMMKPVLTKEEIKNNFNQLVEHQNNILANRNAKLMGTVQHVLVEGTSRTNENTLTGRTEHGKIVNFEGDLSNIGKIVNVKITQTATWSLKGDLI